MRVFLGMILGALFLVAGVYIYDSMSTSTVASASAASSGFIWSMSGQAIRAVPTAATAPVAT